MVVVWNREEESMNREGVWEEEGDRICPTSVPDHTGHT